MIRLFRTTAPLLKGDREGLLAWPCKALQSFWVQRGLSAGSERPAEASVSSGSPAEEPKAETSVKKKPEFYSSTPLIFDSRSNAPLKSSEYASSHNDPFGVQRNWFTSLYKQLNYLAKTGAVPSIQGRQRQVFEAVEKEFESLYEKYVRDAKGVAATAGIEQRAIVLMCLSIATQRILQAEFPDPAMALDVIRTNQGSMMMSILMPLHRLRIWVLKRLLSEDPHRLAAQFLTALQSDMGALCQSEVTMGKAGDVGSNKGETASTFAAALKTKTRLPDEVSLVVHDCKYHSLLTAEKATELLPDFCCQHGMVWINEFQKHGVDVSLDRCRAWEDDCCTIRIARQGSSRV